MKKKLIFIIYFLSTTTYTMEIPSLRSMCLSQAPQHLYNVVNYDNLEKSTENVKSLLEILPEELQEEVIDETDFRLLPDWKTRTIIKLETVTIKNFQYCNDFIIWCRHNKVFIHQRDPKNGQEILTPLHHDEPIHMVCKAPNAPLFAAASANYLFLYALEQSKIILLNKIPLQNSTALAFSWSPEPMLCVGNNQGKLCFFKNFNKETIDTSEETFTDPTGSFGPIVQSLAISPQGKYMVIGCNEQATYVVYLDDDNKVSALDCFNDTKNVHEIFISDNNTISCNTFTPMPQSFIFKYNKGKVEFQAIKPDETTLAMQHNLLLQDIKGKILSLTSSDNEVSYDLIKMLFIEDPFFFTPSNYGQQKPCLLKRQTQKYCKVLTPFRLSSEDNKVKKLVFKVAIQKAIHAHKPKRLKTLIEHPLFKTFHQSKSLHTFFTGYVRDLKDEKNKIITNREIDPPVSCLLS